MPADRVSSRERAEVLRDPLVRRVMELFDGELVYIERGPRGNLRPQAG